MSPRDTRDNPPQFFIGPNSPDDPDSLLEEARQRIHDEDERNKESNKLARRLLVAFILIVLLGVVFFIVLPYYGLRLPPFVPILCFGAIATGAILSANESDPDHDNDPGSGDGSGGDDCDGGGGCAVGMCPGPRPLRMFNKPKDDK